MYTMIQLNNNFCDRVMSRWNVFCFRTIRFEEIERRTDAVKYFWQTNSQNHCFGIKKNEIRLNPFFAQKKFLILLLSVKRIMLIIQTFLHPICNRNDPKKVSVVKLNSQFQWTGLVIIWSQSILFQYAYIWNNFPEYLHNIQTILQWDIEIPESFLFIFNYTYQLLCCCVSCFYKNTMSQFFFFWMMKNNWNVWKWNLVTLT